MNEELRNFLTEQGYKNLVELPTGEVAGLMKFLFTTGIVVGMTMHGYRIRFCFEHAADAFVSLDQWDGIGYPGGAWIKAKGTDEYGVNVDELNPNLK